MCKIKSVPQNGTVPSADRKKMVSIDFLDMLLSAPENAIFQKKQKEFPNANNANKFTAQFVQQISEASDLSLESKFYINIDCPENREELTLEHIGTIIALFQEPYKGQLLWGYTTSHKSHYSVEMLIQI